MGADRGHLTEPPARDGYSVARRALAGLLGVRLVTPGEQAGPIPPATSASPGTGRHISAAAAIAAADPLVRLTVRQSPLVAAVPIADLLVRALDINDKLMSSDGRVNDGNLASARTLSHDLDRTFGRARDFALARQSALDLDPGLAYDLERALDPARAHDLALDLNHILYNARSRVLDLARALARALDNALGNALDNARAFALDRARDRARDLAVALARARPPHRPTRPGADNFDSAPYSARDSDRDRDRARTLAFVIVGALSDLLGIEHLDGLADALLNGALDDFGHADLSGVDLAHIDLGGVHWSVSGTRWPAGLDVEALMQQSEETGPGSGIYVIPRRGETERANEEVRV